MDYGFDEMVLVGGVMNTVGTFVFFAFFYESEGLTEAEFLSLPPNHRQDILKEGSRLYRDIITNRLQTPPTS